MSRLTVSIPRKVACSSYFPASSPENENAPSASARHWPFFDGVGNAPYGDDCTGERFAGRVGDSAFHGCGGAAAIPVATIASDTDVFLKFIEESFGSYGIMTDKSIEKFNRLPN